MKTKSAVAVLASLAQESRLDVFRELVRTHDPVGAGIPAGELAKRLDIPAPTLSFHLKELRQAGLLAATRQGRSILYAVDFEAMAELLGFLLEDCCQGCCTPTLINQLQLTGANT